MELQEIVREYRDDIHLGMGWVIVWKFAENWQAFMIHLNADNVLIDEDLEMAKFILSQDEDAIVLYDEEDFDETMTDKEMAESIDWYYVSGRNLLQNWVAFSGNVTTVVLEPGEIVKAMLGSAFALCRAGLDKGDASNYTAIGAKIIDVISLVREMERGMK